MSREGRRPRWLQGWHVTLVCMMLAAALLAPYASQFHDAFEAVTSRLGLSVEEPNLNKAPLEDYSLPGDGRAGQFLAVVVGMIAVFALTYGAARGLAHRPEPQSDAGEEER